ncbi:MAG: ABC transporter ATP-binding protein [Gemmatimonadota bacterium]
MRSGPPAIETRGLGRDFGAIHAVKTLDLTVERGEFFGFLGPNGAGKTTTIHMLATVIRPSRGGARVEGFDILKEPLEVRRRIGIVFQDTTLDGDLTVEQNLVFAARLYGLRGLEARGRIDHLLELFDLTGRRRERVGFLSGGMRRALDVARGILHRPSLLFLDEPTLGLDPGSRRRTWAFLHRLRQSEAMTFFLTTHYLEEVEDCDRVAILRRGELAALGTPAEVRGDAASLEEAFLTVAGSDDRDGRRAAWAEDPTWVPEGP